MTTPRFAFRWLAAAMLCAVLWAGCSKSEQDSATQVPKTPQEAATHVEKVFADAPPQVQKAVTMAAEGMRQGDYERAVASLTALRQQENLTLQQGLTLHNSMVAMEGQILRAMQAGDPRAKQAFETLKRLKRN